MRPLGLIALIALASAACPGAKGPSPAKSASTVQPASNALVVRGGILYTMDPARPRAEMAVAVGGRFTCVGLERECEPRAPAGARVVDLAGGTATPGLADAHGHVVALGRTLEQADLRGAKSEEECVERLKQHATSAPADAWILGRGWDQNRWPGQRLPREGALSRAVPDHPVLASRIDGHAVWVNARALQLAGITNATPDPPGGRIERDPSGRPTGVLVDNAQELVRSKVPTAGPEATRKAILAAQDRLLAVGLTSVHDAGVDGATLEIYRSLAAQNQLTIHVYAMLDGQKPLAELDAQMALWSKTPRVGLLSVGAVKLHADGALGSRGALLFEPYSDDAGNRGLAVIPPDELWARIERVARAGFQPAVHAIGDRACAETLTDFVLASRIRDDLRPRVEHLQVLRARDVPLLMQAKAVASMQPTHATSDGPWAEARLGHGSERQRGAYAWRTVLDAGAPLACGSDFPVEDPDPRAGIYSAETRRWAGGPAAGWMPEQRMTREEAIRCFTTGAAYAEHAEHERGRIQEGYEADLTGWGGDILGVPPEAVPTLPVTWTVIAGRIERSP